MGSLPDFPGQSAGHDRVPAAGACLPDRLTVCGGLGP